MRISASARACIRQPLQASSFSLLELVVVLLLLAMMAAIVAPRLAGHFAGRGLDDEARRLWAAAESARAEAIQQGVGMSLRFDPEAATYTVAAAPGLQTMSLPAPFAMAVDLEIVDENGDVPADLQWDADGTVLVDSAPAWILRDRRRPDDHWRLVYDGDAAAYRLSREVSP